MATLLQDAQCVVERDGRYEVVTQHVLISDGRIAAMGDEAATAVAARGAEIVRARERLVVPGFANLHGHCIQSLQRGIVAAAPLELWLLLVSSSRGLLTPRDYYVSALLSSIERLRTGTTAFINLALSGEFPDEAAARETFRAYDEAGIRATLAPGFVDLSYTECLPWQDELIPEHLRRPTTPRTAAEYDALFALLDRLRVEFHGRSDDRLRLAIGPSQPQRCSEELLRRTADYADRHGLVIHTHLLESRMQVLMARTGRWGSFVEYLDRTGCLGERTSLAHGTWLSEAEVQLVTDRGAWLVHNPIGNLRLGDGIAPVARYLAAGARVAMGTDGCSSCGSVSMLDGLHAAAVLGNVGGADHTEWLDQHDVLRLATRNGAAALQFPDAGTMEVGARADLVLYDLRDFPFVPLNDAVEQLVYGGHRAIVDRVYVGGELVVRDGHLTRVDEGAVYAEANEIAEKLRRDFPNVQARAAELWPAIERVSDRAYNTIGPGRVNLLW
jgi:5-methylthioadenosine/S-adenosylhomocysteine deaminase